jgi:GNAT superfamily N-acetyltransferase
MTQSADRTGIRIRAGEEKDLSTILGFIKGLADYERLANEVVATEEVLQKELFGTHPAAEVRIASLDGTDVGFAIFFHNFSTFLGRKGLYLEDLFVTPEIRGKGVGKALFVHLAQLAVERGCGRFEWSVLDWNESAIDFYTSRDAVPQNGWTTFRLSGPALATLAASSA